MNLKGFGSDCGLLKSLICLKKTGKSLVFQISWFFSRFFKVKSNKRIISERTLEIDEELSVCFIDWQKAFDRVN
jgi:hypothetical protein